jgi:hypothetical protein
MTVDGPGFHLSVGCTSNLKNCIVSDFPAHRVCNLSYHGIRLTGGNTISSLEIKSVTGVVVIYINAPLLEIIIDSIVYHKGRVYPFLILGKDDNSVISFLLG